MAEEERPVIHVTDLVGGAGREWSEQRKGRSLMIVSCVVVVGVLLLGAFKREQAPIGPAMKPAAPPATAQTITMSARDLRRLEEEARDKAAVAPREAPRALTAPVAKSAERRDPAASDREKRRYDSLLSSPVVVSRRPPSDQPSSAGEGRRQSSAMRSGEAQPTLDETAAAVVRASQRANGGSGQVLPGVTPVTSPVTPHGPAGWRQAMPEQTPPLTEDGPRFTLLEGTILEGILRIRLNNTSASPVKVLVTTPVYSHGLRHVLIPAGAELLGETKRAGNYGEDRASVTFDRLIFPDGRTEPLRSALGLNQAGDAAWTGNVNRHLLSTLGVSAAIGLITGAAQSVSGTGRAGDNSTVIVAGDVANRSSQATQQVLQRELSRPWTITIPEGKIVRIWLAEDLSLPSYGEKPRTK